MEELKREKGKRSEEKKGENYVFSLSQGNLVFYFHLCFICTLFALFLILYIYLVP